MISLINYIKPTDDIKMFIKTVNATMKLSNISGFNLLFKNKLSEEYVQILNENGIYWDDEIDGNWADKILWLMKETPSDYYLLWEEDCYLFNHTLFNETFSKMVDTNVDYMFIQDQKWIKRAEFLNDNGYAIEDDNFFFFNWGTYYAKYCRENSNNYLINGAYPVVVGGVYKRELLHNLLITLTSSDYWERIVNGKYNHFHQNPQLPHSFEVCDQFWWPPKGDGDVEYSVIVNKIQFGEELGGRLNEK